MSILNLNESQLKKIAKKAGMNIDDLKKAAGSLIDATSSNDLSTANTKKLKISNEFYAIRLRSRQTQMHINTHLMK